MSDTQCETLKYAIDMYKFEMDMYWKRATYFSILIGGLGAGYFQTFPQHLHKAFLISVLGLFIAFFWLLANKSSKFWVTNWLLQLEHFEKPPLEKSDYLFGIYRVPPVYRNLSNILLPGKSFPFSVSKLNHYVSFTVFVAWVFAVVFSSYKIIVPLGPITGNKTTLDIAGLIVVCALFITFVVLGHILFSYGWMSDLKHKPSKFIIEEKDDL